MHILQSEDMSENPIKIDLNVDSINKEYQSPNFEERSSKISMLVMHYTDMFYASSACERLIDPQSRVSSHYLVDEVGEIFSLVPDEKMARHAGISHWRGDSGLNDSSIGIEIANPGRRQGYYKKFESIQMLSVLALGKYLVEEYNIEKRNVVGHSDIAPERKEDPGPMFNWNLLSHYGIGNHIKPNAEDVVHSDIILCKSGDEGSDVLKMQEDLSQYGYNIEKTGIFDKQAIFVVRAFKSHFAPEQFDSNWDILAEKRMEYLLEDL